MDTIYKILDDCEVKKLGDRNYEFTASTSTVDRDGEVIDAKGWDLKNFKKNPVIMYAHDYRSLPIGKAPKVWLTGGKLKNTVSFPPEGTYEFADIVERLVDTGYLKTESVGFIPDPDKIIEGDGKKTPKRTYKKQELLEISIVPVPSNPDALRNAIDNGVITTKEFDAITKPEDIISQSLITTPFFVNHSKFHIDDLLTKPEETDDWVRIPIKECKVTATIDVSEKEGIKALYCGKEKQVKTYMFDKRDPYNWTMAKAKKWVEDHKKQETYQCECIECGHKLESEKHCADIKCPECGGEMRRAERPGPGREAGDIEEKVVTQAGVKDEIDYLKSIIEDVGLNEEAMDEAWELVRDIMRLAGDDIPEDIRDTIGVMITGQQELKIRDAIDYLTAYLMGANVAEEKEPDEIQDEPKEVDEARIGEIIVSAVGEAIGKAQGKI